MEVYEIRKRVASKIKVRIICHLFEQGQQGPPGPQGPRGLGLGAPELVKSNLKDGVVNLTDSKTFKCTFFGNPIPRVSWESPKTDFEISVSVDKHNYEITSRLILENISWSDQGPFKCRANSLLGEDSGAGNLTTLCE